MPTHTHSVNANRSPGAGTRPPGSVPARATTDIYATAPDGSTTMNPGMIGNAGGGQPHGNIQPFLVLNFCIALQGILPSRN